MQVVLDPPSLGATVQGQRESQQDVYVYATWNGGRVEMTAVLDGHGEYGDVVARAVADQLPRELARTLDIGAALAERDDEVERSIADAIWSLQMQLWASPDRQHFLYSGTTLTACIFINREHLYVVNVGDSRTILVTPTFPYAQQMTRDHKPSDHGEQQRIYRCGASVAPDEYNVLRVQPIGLAMTRAIGDLASFMPACNAFSVSTTPEVNHLYFADVFNDMAAMLPPTAPMSPAYIVLASDGVWDVLSNDDVARLVNSADPDATPAERARIVVNEALARQSTDNCTAMIVPLVKNRGRGAPSRRV